MKWNVGTKIAFGFGLAVAVFVIVGTASYQAATQLVESANGRRDTFLVVNQLDRSLTLLREVELGNRTYYLTDDDRSLEQSRAAADQVTALIPQLRTLTKGNPRLQQQLDALEPLVRARLDFARETVAVYRVQGQKGVLQRIRGGQGQAINNEIGKIVAQMQAEESALLKQLTEDVDANVRNTKWTILLGTLVGLVLAALAGFLIQRNISLPLQRLTAVAKRITVGDIAASVPVEARSDEVGELMRTFADMTNSLRAMATAAEQMAAGDLQSTVQPQSADDVLGTAFARMTGSLREQIRGMVDVANVLGVSATEIVTSTTELAATASQSAAAVAQTTATVEEVRQTAQLSSQKARLVSDSAQKAVQSAQGGRKSAEDVGVGMDRIRQQMEAIATSMARLSEHSQSIGQIIATVEDLAVQSNLLAVNAAIEAAKAGEHGKGFGVVAQEVKSLATQSRQATGQVRTLLGDIQKATASAVMATEQGAKAVEAGGRQTVVASESIQALAGSVNEAAQAAMQIAASSQQQLVGVDQVAGAMDSIKQASSQNMVSARQLETAARNLNDLGHRLKQMVASYKL